MIKINKIILLKAVSSFPHSVIHNRFKCFKHSHIPRNVNTGTRNKN